MLAYRRAGARADVVHFQWLAVQQLDAHLLPRRSAPAGARRPLVLTAHDILPREPWPGQRRAQLALYERFDAVVVHSEHGRARLRALGVPDARVHVIPHGVLRPWEGAPERPLPPELPHAPGPVVLFFGLLRPYKGIDVLLEAWRGVEGAELWIVGMPRMDVTRLRASSPPGVRWLTRFVDDGELHALLRRADVLVLPYREIEQSGVAFAGLGAGVPLLLSDAGGFPELAASAAARVFPAGSASALREALRELLDDADARAHMAAAGTAAAGAELSWESIARRTLALYRSLLAS
jgi:glycosyltransferase involved in cell wall biosynthesis